MSLGRVLGRLPSLVASRIAAPNPLLQRVSLGWAASVAPARSFSVAAAGPKDVSGYKSQVCAVLGGQWGDEGKGKLVDILARRYDIVARFNGGANAGHTLVVDGKKFAFHLLPCGMLSNGKINVIGNGVVLDVPALFTELKALADAGIDWKDGRLKISDRAHLLFDVHKVIDGSNEKALGDKSIGTTKKGIGPCYSSKATRNGVRVGDLVDWDGFVAKHTALIRALQAQFPAILADYDIKGEQDKYKQWREALLPMVLDTVYYVNEALHGGKTLLAEGANAALLDLDFGTYPYVTSSATAAGGICTGLGIAPNRVETTIGIVKAYTTRVGAGPFPTELEDATGERLRKIGGEFGTTTGRPRRCGWLDLPVVQYGHMLNNYSSINITKLDVLTGLDTIQLGVAYRLNGKRLRPGQMPSTLQELAKVEVEYESYSGWKEDISKIRRFEDLPAAAKVYLGRVEHLLGVPVSWVGVGAGRVDMATKGFLAM